MYINKTDNACIGQERSRQTLFDRRDKSEGQTAQSQIPPFKSNFTGPTLQQITKSMSNY